MLRFLFFFSLLAGFCSGQTVADCKKRFDNYLNFRGALNGEVQFEKEGIYLLNTRGQRELALYAEELPLLSEYFANSSLKEQENLVAKKKLRHYSRRELDSLLITTDDKRPPRHARDKALSGYRIAIDPGHFSTNLRDAKVEQKYLYFLRDSLVDPTDTVKLFESQLTFTTAQHLRILLESQGAEVLITRSQSNYTSFNCTWERWLSQHRRRHLDSLKQKQLISPERHKQLIKVSDYKLFWDFFRDYDLANRARKINAFNPHLTVIIHFNVDETNDPWRKTTERNFTMAFIGGAVTRDHLQRSEGRINFLRLLLTPQLNESERLAAATVRNFNKELGIPIAAQLDAIYLKDNCLATNSPGVFCRNLILCRKINSPLVYGESLYQDNVKESRLLMQNDQDVYGIKASMRLSQVARCYYDAVMEFVK